MPTLPPERSPASLTRSHQARQIAESFGIDPRRYDRARPRYPDALVARIVAGSTGSDVLDVGCGTGIAARQFQRSFVLAEGIEVASAILDNGLLHIDLLRPEPKPITRNIEIRTAASEAQSVLKDPSR